MRLTVRSALLVVLLLATTRPSYATSITIDFGATPTFASADGDMRTLIWTVDGVSVSFTGYNLFQTWTSHPHEGLTTQGIGVYPITVEILDALSVRSAEFTNVISGVYSDEVDVIEGIAFNASGDIVADVTSGDFTHRLEGPGITSIIYQNPPSHYGDGMVLMDLKLDVCSEFPGGGNTDGCYPGGGHDGEFVPDPGSTLLLLSTGIAGVAPLARRTLER